MHVVEAPPDVTIRPAVRSEAGALVGTLELANAQYRSAMPASIFEMYLADSGNFPSVTTWR